LGGCQARKGNDSGGQCQGKMTSFHVNSVE